MNLSGNEKICLLERVRNWSLEKCEESDNLSIGCTHLRFLVPCFDAQSLCAEICKMQQKSAQTDSCTKKKGWVTFHWVGFIMGLPLAQNKIREGRDLLVLFPGNTILLMATNAPKNISKQIF